MNTDAPSPTDDPIRAGLMERAAACLDHIRAVKWGTATSQYQIIDRDMEVNVAIEVRCYSAKKEK